MNSALHARARPRWLCRHRRRDRSRLLVRVPPGCGAGSQLTVLTPRGRPLRVTVPFGAYPGCLFEVYYVPGAAPAALVEFEVGAVAPQPCPKGCGFCVEPGSSACCRLCNWGVGHGPFCKRIPLPAQEIVEATDENGKEPMAPAEAPAPPITVGTPVVEAPSVAAAGGPGASAPIAPVVALLRENLGLDGNMNEVVQQAAAMLGVDPTGKSLPELANECVATAGLK